MLNPMLTLVRAAEEAPDPNDVVAGWVGFAVFVGLIVAVALLGWSLTKHLRKTDRAAEQGVFGEYTPKGRQRSETDEGPEDDGAGRA